MEKLIFALAAFKMPNSNGTPGGVISNYYMIDHLSQRMNIAVVCPSCHFSENNDLNNVNFEIIKQKKTKGAICRFFFQAKLLIKLFSLCARQFKGRKKITLISNTATIPCTYFISRLFGMKHIILCRAYEEFLFGNYNPVLLPHYYAKARGFVNLGLTRKAYEHSQIITNSKWMLLAVKKSFNIKNKIELLYPPINTNELPRVNQRVSIKTVGFINRGVMKGHSIVITLAFMLPLMKFHVYGDKNVFLDNTIPLPENVILIGWENASVIFNDIDLLLVPSSWPEPFGRVSIEAQKAMIPVLVSNNGGLPETVILDDFIVKGENSDEWLKSFHLINDNYLFYLSEISKKNYFLNKFSFEAHNSRLDDIFIENII